MDLASDSEKHYRQDSAKIRQKQLPFLRFERCGRSGWRTPSLALVFGVVKVLL